MSRGMTSGGMSPGLRVALLADAHGNLHALEAVLAHAARQNVQEYWFLGDFVGYGPHPDEVVRRLFETGAISISGNYDRKALRLGDPDEVERLRKSKSPKKFLAFKWAHDHLSPESRALLSALPEQCAFDAGGVRVLMTHASPATRKEHITPDTPAERLAQLAAIAKDEANAELVLVGHSHEPFDRQAAGVQFVNPGSIGRPDDGDPRAAYAVLTFEDGRCVAALHRVPYDVQAAAKAVRAAGLPDEFAQMLLQGRDLNHIKAEKKADKSGKPGKMKNVKEEETQGPRPDPPAGKYD